MQDHTRTANALSHLKFYESYVRASLDKAAEAGSGSMTYHFDTSSSISPAHFKACFDLVAETSSAAYRASTRGWSAADKKVEMREADMRYVQVFARAPVAYSPPDAASRSSTQHPPSNGDVATLVAFLSFMITEEDDEHVVYCYEIHVSPQWQGKRIGAALMRIMEDIGRAARMDKAMLTVFASNKAGIRFYERLGYEKYDEEPPPKRKKLRSRLTGQSDWKPTYIIMAKDIDHEEEEEDAA